jgi:hypothetical protein
MEPRLPPGYYLELDADAAVLREGQGRSVAVFSTRGVIWETVERIAWDDHRERATPKLAPPRKPLQKLTPGRPPSPPRPPG